MYFRCAVILKRMSMPAQYPMDTLFLILPGLGDSGEGHWQHHWLQKFPNAVKLVQEDWEKPMLKTWLKRLNQVVESLDSPIVFVAHSLSASLVAHWSANYVDRKVIGAMLVAPADVDSPEHTPDSVRSFSPIPLQRLSFPSVVVASENDTFVSLERASFFAQHWGSHFINLGKKGHINSDSRLKEWKEGQEILENFIQHVVVT